MILLLDTHLLLWAASEPKKLSTAARKLLTDPTNVLMFSPVSLWEIVIKRSLDRPDFQVEPRRLRRGLLDHGYGELTVTSEHVIAVDRLPSLHKDPFDRLLLAQAEVEGFTLLTADKALAAYRNNSVRKV